jgi:23S rRNA (uracil1939-C5)-methyltransferase
MKTTPRSLPREPVELKVEKLVYGGEGLARQGGVTYFVPLVAPGETVLAEPMDRRRNFIRARPLRVLEPAEGRVEPPCPYFGLCGGCHYQHLRYELQLEVKRDILRETLRRLGGVHWEGPIGVHPSHPFGYRNRAQWKIRPRSSGAGLALGYFRMGSRSLCPVDQCALLAPPLAEALQALGPALAAEDWPRELEQIEAFATPEGALLLTLTLETLPADPGRVIERLRELLPATAGVLLHGLADEQMHLEGPGFVVYRVAERQFRVGHLSFFQVNRFLLEPLPALVVGETAGGLALDLFAGVGLFTVELAQRFEQVVAVEADPAAARDLEHNLGAAGARTRAVNADVVAFLNGWTDRPDLVVLDPPRSGVPMQALEALARLAPPRIHYLSCDPATLARDLRHLLAAGYRVEDVQLLDMFPQTYHLEALVRLVHGS